MSRYKMPPLSARNWDALVELDADAVDPFGKVRAVARGDEESRLQPKRSRVRESFHRVRYN